MGKLRNEASISHSFLATLQTCQRKAFWRRFGGWEGWQSDAPEEARLAYRLGKMTGIYALIGRAVEEQCRRALHLAREGTAPTAADLVRGARQRLRTAWLEHQSRGWKHDPKRVTCIQEAYFEERMPSKEAVTERLTLCLEHFVERTLPGLASIPAGRFLTIDDLDAFSFEGVKVYAVPDLGYSSTPDEIVIVDLKSGKVSGDVAWQLGLYALWAVERYGAPGSPLTVTTRAEYLLEGKTVEERWAADELEWVRERLRDGLKAYRALLVDGDLERHEALPQERWKRTQDERECVRCEYREPCAPPCLAERTA